MMEIESPDIGETVTLEQLMAMPKENKMRFLLNKFSMQRWVPIPSDDWEQFWELLKLNSQLKKPLDLSLNTWYFINEKAKTEWLRMHPDQEIIDSKYFTDQENFIEIAKEHQKVEQRRDNSTLIHLPGTHFRPTIEVVKPVQTSQVGDLSDLPNYFGKKKSKNSDNIFSRKSTYNNSTPIENISPNSTFDWKSSNPIIFDNVSTGQVLSDIQNILPQHANDSDDTKMEVDCENSKSSTPSKQSTTIQKQEIIQSASNSFLKSESQTIKSINSFTNPLSNALAQSTHHAMYPINANMNPIGEEMNKKAHTTLHQDMLRMTKRFDFFMDKFIKMEEDLKEMKINFEKVVDFATKSESRKEKQSLLTDLNSTSKSLKEASNVSNPSSTSIHSDCDDDDYEKLIKKEQKRQIKQEKYTNGDIDISQSSVSPISTEIKSEKHVQSQICNKSSSASKSNSKKSKANLAKWSSVNSNIKNEEEIDADVSLDGETMLEMLKDWEEPPAEFKAKKKSKKKDRSKHRSKESTED